MSLELILVLVFVVTTLIGYKLIKNVPSLLHTPLMSGMNALSGITILATMTATAAAITTGSHKLLVLLSCLCWIMSSSCAIISGPTNMPTINVVAGFGLTDRMLKMFKTGNESKEGTK